MFRKTAAAFGALAVMSMSTAAPAQDYQALREASIALYNTCLTAAGAAATSAGCACTAGFLGGALSEREYDIAARLGTIGTLIEGGASDAEVTAEVAAFFAAGYTEADADIVTAKLDVHTARGNAICSPYENRSVSS